MAANPEQTAPSVPGASVGPWPAADATAALSDAVTGVARAGKRVGATAVDALTSPEIMLRFVGLPALGGLLALLGGMVLGLAAAGSAYFGDPELLLGNPNRVLLLLRNGGLFVYSFERVPLYRDVAGPFGLTRAEAVFVPFTGMLLVAATLVFAGGFVARRITARPAVRVIAGAAVAIPFALGSFLAPFVFPNPSGAPGAPTPAAWAPSRAASFFSPLLLGLILAALGAAKTSFVGNTGTEGRKTDTARRVAKASSGGVRSAAAWSALLGTAVVLAIFTVLAQQHSAEREALFADPKAVVATVASIVFFLPNLVVGALLGSMGVPIHVQNLLTEQLPPGSTSYGYTSGLPPYAWAALVVPAMITIRAGFVAARASHESPRRAVAAAVMTGVGFACLCWLLAVLGEVRVTQGRVVTLGVWVSPVVSLLVPLGWGVVGGWIGALAYLRGLGAAGRVGVAPATTMPVAVRSCGACGWTNEPGAGWCGRCGSVLGAEGRAVRAPDFESPPGASNRGGSGDARDTGTS